MKIISLRGFVIFCLVGLTGAFLLYTSQNVQRAELELQALQSVIAQEQESLRVLAAEWDYLNSPARLEVLASEYLDLGAPQSDQMVSNPEILPPVTPQNPSGAFDSGYQNISHSSADISEANESAVRPPRKPQMPSKSFNKLLKDMEGTP